MYQFFLPLVIAAQVALTLFGGQDACWGCYRNYYAPGSSVELSFNWASYHDSGVSFNPIQDIVDRRHWVAIRVEQTPQEYKLYPGQLSSAPTDIGLSQLVVDVNEVISETLIHAVAYYNEPNVDDSDYAFIGGYGKSYDAGLLYTRHLCEFYNGVKSVHPGVSIIGGELTNNKSDFVRAFIENSEGCYDYLAIHSYSVYGDPDYDEIPEYISWLYSIGLPIDTKIIVSEIGLQYSGDCKTPGFIIEQEAYYRYVIEHLYSWGAVAAFAYTVGGNGWLCTDASSAGLDSPAFLYYYSSFWFGW